MSTKAGAQQMCDVMVKGLSWIDNEPNSELITSLKNYRQQLINLPNTVIEGQPVNYPDDPRFTRCC